MHASKCGQCCYICEACKEQQRGRLGPPAACSTESFDISSSRIEPSRLAVHAGECDQCWYCSEACKELHWSHGQAGAVCSIPHKLTCPVLSFFGGSKCDADMESVLHMCLDALALQMLQQPAPGELATLLVYRTEQVKTCPNRHRESLCTNAKGQIRQTTAPLARGQNGSVDMHLYNLAKRKKATCKEPQTLSLLVQSSS